MSVALRGTRAAGLAVGWLADRAFGDPRHGHPVAAFGRAAAALERRTYADDRIAGTLHGGVLLAALAGLGIGAERTCRNPIAHVVVTATATFVALGGTTLVRTGTCMAVHLDGTDGGDLDAARNLLPSLCGRDPAALDAAGLVRATVESVAENTSDAQVAPLYWGALGGIPALLVYRGVNTLDAMIGHRSVRYERFGWGAARLDDAFNYVPARVTGVLTALCAPAVGGSARSAVGAWRRDARRHPSPNAGVVEAAFAGALAVRLGGRTRYPHRTEERPTLGAGNPPAVADLRRALRLSRAVQTVAAVLAVSVACRTGRRCVARA